MKKKIKLIAVIPAHLDSVRLKRKVLIDLFGIPMIEHVRRRVLNSKIFENVNVSSGDEEILNIVEKFGGETIRTDMYQYSEWKGGASMFYDHSVDPDENINKVDDPKYKSIIQKMKKRLKEHREQL